MIRPESLGYYLDTFFIEKDLQMIEDKKILSSIQTALHHFGLRIGNVVSKKEFMENTRSVQVNRYARLPNRLLSQYDERVFSKNTLEALTDDPGEGRREVVRFDPKKPKSEQANLVGVKLDENVHFENSYFHNIRYMSCIMTTHQNRWSTIQVKYNYKLSKALPSIVDLTAYTGIVLTHACNCDGIYTRAGSFARSEEYFCYVHDGKIMSSETGNDTCVGYVQPAKLTEMHGISAREVMDEIDNKVSIHYAADDMVEIEKIKKNHFQKYGVDRSDVYKKLDMVLDDWWTRENRHPNAIINLIKQMLQKEGNLDAIVSEKGKEEEELTRVSNDIAQILISRTTIKNLLYKDSGVRDIYFKIDSVSR